MPSSSAVVLALAVLGVGAASAFAQGAATSSSRVVVYPLGAASSSTRTSDPGANLPPPPPGPIESRIVALPDGSPVPSARELGHAAPPATSAAPSPIAPRVERPVYVTPPVTWGGTVAAAAAPPATPAAPPASEAVSAIPFSIRSASLSDAAKAELERVAKSIKDKRLGRIELQAFATGGDPDSRKIALARALVVRSYLIDQGVKARIEVGSFAGEGEHVEILVPSS